MSTNVVATSQKVPMKEKIAFGLGDIGTNFYLQTIAVFLVFFYTDVLGISAALAGSIALICRFFDAFNDLLIGYRVDKTGNIKKWIVWGASLSVVLFVVMFLSPSLSAGGKFAYALITFCIWTIAYTCYGVPINAMASTITADHRERANLNAIRFPFIAVPILIATAATPVLVKLLAPAVGIKAAYPIIFGAYGLIGLILAIVCVKVVKERNPIVKKSDANKLKFNDVVQSFRGNKPAIVAILIFFLFFLQYYTGQASLAYYFSYVLGDGAIMSLYSLISLPFMVVGMLLSGKICNRFGKKWTVFVVSVIIFVSYVIRYAFMSNLSVQIICGSVFSIMAGYMCAMCYNMVGDAVTYANYRTGKQVVAVFYSTAIFSQKLSMALAGFIVGGVLGVFGYIANTVQTDLAITGIMSIYSLIPAVLGLITGFVGLAWTLDKHECFGNAPSHESEASVAM